MPFHQTWHRRTATEDPLPGSRIVQSCPQIAQELIALQASALWQLTRNPPPHAELPITVVWLICVRDVNFRRGIWKFLTFGKRAATLRAPVPTTIIFIFSVACLATVRTHRTGFAK